MRLTYEGKMMVAGHRGDSANYPENTMQAFRAAIAAGADMIETDVRMTKDGVLVLIHDKSVDRTTDGTGYVKDMTFAQLRALNAGTQAAPQPIPALEELLELLSGSGVTLNLEVKEYWEKGNEARSRQCVDKCVALLEQYRMGEMMLFNSFDAPVLEYIDLAYPGRYRLHGFYPYSEMYRVGRDPGEYLYCACLSDNRNAEHYAYLLAKGIEPWVGASVRSEEHLAECFRLGARLVTTNDPGDCLEKLERIGARWTK